MSDTIGWIEVLTGTRSGTRLTLDERYLYEVGNTAECHLELPGEGVSDLHAQLHIHEGRLILSDLGKGDTSVNGHAIAGSVFVEPGDVLGFATARTRFEAPGAEPTVAAEIADPQPMASLAATCMVEPPQFDDPPQLDGTTEPEEDPLKKTRLLLHEEPALLKLSGEQSATPPTRIMEASELTKTLVGARTEQIEAVDFGDLKVTAEVSLDPLQAAIDLAGLEEDSPDVTSPLFATQFVEPPAPLTEPPGTATFGEIPIFDDLDDLDDDDDETWEFAAPDLALKSLREEVVGLEDDVQRLQAEADRIPGLQQELSSAQLEVQRLVIESSKARAQNLLGGEVLEEAYSERNDLRGTLAELEGRASTAETERDELTDEVTRLREALEGESRQRVRSESSLTEALTSARQAQRDAETVTREREEERDLARASEESLGKELGVARDEQRRLRELAEARGIELDRLLAAAQGERTMLIEEALSERGSLRERIGEVESELNDARQALAGAASAEEGARAVVARTAAENSRLEEFVGDLEEELVESRGQVKAMREAAARVEGLVGELAVARDRARQHQGELREARPRVAALRAERDALVRDIERAEKQLVDLTNSSEREQRRLEADVERARQRCGSLEGQLEQARQRDQRARDEQSRERETQIRRSEGLQARLREAMARATKLARTLQSHGIKPGQRPRPRPATGPARRPAQGKKRSGRQGTRSGQPRPASARRRAPQREGSAPTPVPQSPEPQRPRAPRKRGLVLMDSIFDRVTDTDAKKSPQKKATAGSTSEKKPTGKKKRPTGKPAAVKPKPKPKPAAVKKKPKPKPKPAAAKKKKKPAAKKKKP